MASRMDTPSTLRILLAEDDDAMRALVTRALTRAGFDVVEAASGSDALDKLACALVDVPRQWFDLVISDVRMPGYDGLNVLVSIKKLPFTTPVILMTAYGSAATHASALRLGAFAVLDKPFDVEVLVGLAQAALAGGSGS